MFEGEGLGEGTDRGGVEGGRDGELVDGAEVGLDLGDESGPEGGAGGLVEEEERRGFGCGGHTGLPQPEYGSAGDGGRFKLENSGPAAA
jgi:hypothetical protein